MGVRIGFYGALLVFPGFIVKSDQVTTAYGVFMSVYALVVSVIASGIIDHYGYHLLLLIFYIVLLFLISLVVFALSISEMYQDSKVINVTGKKRWLGSY